VAAGPDKLGVGIFFRQQVEDGSMRVLSVPLLFSFGRVVLSTGG